MRKELPVAVYGVDGVAEGDLLPLVVLVEQATYSDDVGSRGEVKQRGQHQQAGHRRESEGGEATEGSRVRGGAFPTWLLHYENALPHSSETKSNQTTKTLVVT